MAAFVDGADVVTIEGLAEHGVLDPVQEAFVSQGGLQCGFCTPGFVLMTKACSSRNHIPRRSDSSLGQAISALRSYTGDHQGCEDGGGQSRGR